MLDVASQVGELVTYTVASDVFDEGFNQVWKATDPIANYLPACDRLPRCVARAPKRIIKRSVKRQIFNNLIPSVAAILTAQAHALGLTKFIATSAIVTANPIFIGGATAVGLGIASFFIYKMISDRYVDATDQAESIIDQQAPHTTKHTAESSKQLTQDHYRKSSHIHTLDSTGLRSKPFRVCTTDQPQYVYAF